MTIQSWRRIVRIFITTLVLGLPFLKIGGESALRFDIPGLRLYFFGSVLWLEEFFTLLVALLFFVFLLVLLTIMFGRFWCGWICPQTIICEDTFFLDKMKRKSTFYKLSAYVATFIISFIIGANFLWYFISPYEFIPNLLYGKLSGVIWGVWLAFSLKVFFIFAFVRRKFCATVCPYAKLQDVLYDDRTLIITFDSERKDECLRDGKCVRNCPINMDIRKGTNALCINCAQCIDKCVETMCRRGKKSLISYRFGQSSGEKSLLAHRFNVISIMGLTLILLFFFIYLITIRVAFDFSIQPNFKFKPQIAKDMIINSFIVKMENMKKEPVDVDLKISGMEGIHFMNKPEIKVKGGETKNFIVYIATPSSSLTTTSNNSSRLITFYAEIINQAIPDLPEDKKLILNKTVALLLPVKGNMVSQ